MADPNRQPSTLTASGQSAADAENNRLAVAEVHMNKCKMVKFGSPKWGLKMNPLVSGLSAAILWGFIIAIAIIPDEMNEGLMVGKLWVAEYWSWFYIVSQDIWIVALIYIAVHPKYGKLKIGRDDEEPIYSDVTWFSLLFTCGVAVGMFYYVAEPMWHFKGWGGPRFINGKNGYSHPSEDAVHGMMVTWYHWGLHGWIPYTTVGALLGLLAYRRGFPLSMRFGLYPLIGNKVYGGIGDAVDVLSIVTTVMGVCTSLGLGTMSINMGMTRLSQGFYRGTSHNVPDDPKNENPTCAGTGHKYWGFVKHCDEKWVGSPPALAYTHESYGIQSNMNAQACIIIVITLLATCSVVSGLNRGIKDLSRLGFALSCFLLFFVLFTGDTVFQLNLTVQTFGYYIWYLPKIAFHTDAFELLGTEEYGAGGFKTQGAKNWMDIWTIFYWGWWISWGPFVGTFLAKISRGRTVRQFVLCTLVVPSLYCFCWFGCVGGETIKQQSLADGSKLCKWGTGGWLNGGGKLSPATKHCNLAAEEIDTKTGTCKDKATLVKDGVITANDEANCGRGACSGATLTKGRCGKMLPTCDHYAASWATKQKQIRGLGYTPPCKLVSNGEQLPVLSGTCQKFAWVHWEQKMAKCVKITTWVKVPCGDGADPTAGPTLACGAKGDPLKHKACQDACKDEITAAMVDGDKTDRMYNHFTKGTVMSDATKDIFTNMNNKWSADEKLEMAKVMVPDAKGVNRLVLPQCFIPVPDTQVCLWNQKTEDILFDLIGSLTNSRSMSDFISMVSLFALIIYFITSSDSGSLVVDIMGANGEEEPPIPQRVFWAFTEGATAIALLYSGQNVLGPYGDPGEGGLRALQAASIIMGLPYTFMLFWYSQALVQVVREEAGDLDPERPRFQMFLLGFPQSGKVPIAEGAVMVLRNLFVPGFSPAVQEATRTWPGGEISKGRLWQVLLQLLWLLVIAFCLGSVDAYAIFTMACAVHMGFAAWVSLVRRNIRGQWGIPRGDFITDFYCSVFAWFLVLTQLEIQMKEEKIVWPPQRAPVKAASREEEGI